MDKEFTIINLRNNQVIGEMTMKDFSEWVEDTQEYMLWVYGRDYESNADYAKKRMLHELKICSNYSFINKKETEWNKFKFIPI